MTDPNESLPEPPRIPAADAGSRRWELLVWAVIVLCIAFIVVVPHLPRRSAAAADDQAPNIQLQVAGRYLVGTHALLGKQAAASTDALWNQVSASAHTEADSLRATTVLAEVAGAPAALERLDSLEPSLHDEGLRQDAADLRAVYTAHPEAPDQQARERLTSRLGWFGQLAAAYGKGDASPQRQAALAPALRTTTSLFALIGFGFLALVAGLGLAITALVLALGRRFRPAFAPAPPGSVVFLEAFALYLVLSIVVGILARLILHTGLYGQATIVALVMPLAFLWPFIRGRSWLELCAALGWHRGRGWMREIGAGFLGYLAGLPLLALMLVVIALLSRLSGSQATHPIVNEVGQGRWHTVGLYLLACVWAPLIEETMFRGALYHHLRGRLGWLASAAFCGVIFAVIHPQGWIGVPAIAAIGFVLATLREWRGSLIASATAHALNNAFAVTLLLLVAS